MEYIKWNSHTHAENGHSLIYVLHSIFAYELNMCTRYESESQQQKITKYVNIEREAETEREARQSSNSRDEKRC